MSSIDTTGNRIAYLNVAEYAIAKVRELSQGESLKDAQIRKATYEGDDAINAARDALVK